MHNPLLRYVDEVARQRSIRKAAKVLNVASSAVNRQILKLEADLGTKLFERTPEGVELTAAGRVVIEHCRRTLHDYQKLRVTIGDIRDLRTGHVTISTLDSITFQFLPMVLEDFGASYPGVSFTVKTGFPDETMEEVARGTADIGLTFTRDLHPDVRVMADKAAPFGLIVQPGHPLASRLYARPEDCAAYPLVRTYDNRGPNSLVTRDLKLDMLPISTAMFTNSLVVGKQAILANVGIGLYTKIGFHKEVQQGLLHFVPLSGTVSDYRIGIILSAQKNLLTVARLFAETIEAHFRTVEFA
ncbi:MAG TPA: LysR family transcriptional regulator [Aestuariivirgaceae bacterium]|jgi:DNA-binding transcriptional LysR family regulator